MNASILSRPVLPLLALVTAAVVPLRAQTTSASGVAAVVRTLTLSQQLAGATLPTYGGVNTSSTTGMLDAQDVSAQTTSELGSLQILNGLISAQQLLAVASSYANGATAGSDAAGSQLLGLVVAGRSFASMPAPNTRISLPGVGYVVLNEQTVTGNGSTASGIVVNMIHVVLQAPLTGVKIGEIILGSATSAVTL
jgi:hypothetical protein